MPRFFFDIEDGGRTTDEEGQRLNAAAIPEAAIRILFDFGKYEALSHGDRQMTVTVRDEAGTQVYRASVTLQAEWLAKVTM